MTAATNMLRQRCTLAVALVCLLAVGGRVVNNGPAEGDGNPEEHIGVLYNGPQGLCYVRVAPRGKVVPLSPLGANSLVGLAARRALAIDEDGIEVYDLNVLEEAEGNAAIVLRQSSMYPNYLLEGATRCGELLVVTRKHDLSGELWTLDPYSGLVRSVGVGGGVAILPPQGDDDETRDDLIALLELPGVQDRPMLLRLVELGPTPRTVASFSGVLDAAWCREGDRLLAVLSPAEQTKRRLESNLVEWDFQHETVQPLGSGSSFRPPVADGGARVVCGQWSPKGDRVVAISRRDGSVQAVLCPSGVAEEYSDPTALAGGNEVLVLAWPKPKPHSISRWAQLLRCNLSDRHVEMVAGEVNCYTVCHGRRIREPTRLANEP